jgi:hypothetical protein
MLRTLSAAAPTRHQRLQSEVSSVGLSSKRAPWRMLRRPISSSAHGACREPGSARRALPPSRTHRAANAGPSRPQVRRDRVTQPLTSPAATFCGRENPSWGKPNIRGTSRHLGLKLEGARTRFRGPSKRCPSGSVPATRRMGFSPSRRGTLERGFDKPKCTMPVRQPQEIQAVLPSAGCRSGIATSRYPNGARRTRQDDSASHALTGLPTAHGVCREARGCRASRCGVP